MMTEQPLELLSHVTSRRGGHDFVTPLPQNLIRVPVVKQRTDFSCGNAATLALLRYWRWDAYACVDETALYLPLETTHAKGTEPQPIAAYLNRAGGVKAEYRNGDVTVEDLERAIDARQPPIVDLQAWRDQETPWRDLWDAGHYVVLVGYDRQNLFFMDPCTVATGAYVYMPRAELAERWHDLSGDHDEPVEHMAIFVRGSTAARIPDEPAPKGAAKLG
jgi:predicted double-glycine peptidase